MVRTERLELSHLAALEPKSSVSTNSTTSANYLTKKSTKISPVDRDADFATEASSNQQKESIS